MLHPLLEPLEARIAPATLSIAPASIIEGNSGVTQMTFTVTLSEAVTDQVKVNYGLSDDSAQFPDQDYVTTAGTLTFTPGVLTQEFTVTINGDTKLEGDETFLATLSAPDKAELDENAKSAIGTILNDDVVPTADIADAQIIEGDSGQKNLEFTVSLSNPSSTAIVLQAATSDGTALAGSDYISTSSTLTIPAGSTSVKFIVPIRGDGIDEANEAFSVLLTNPGNSNVTLGDVNATGTILNDDLRVRVADATVIEGNEGTSKLIFTVTLSNIPTRAIDVAYTTVDGTAVSTGTNVDFVAQMGTLTFAPGEQSKQIEVLVNGDTLGELNEQMILRLTSATDATITDADGTGTIADDDLSFRIDDVRVVEGSAGSGTAAVFTVTLSQASSSTLLIDVATADGSAISTAQAGQVIDFNATMTTLTFAPGQLTRTFTVPLVGDSTSEANETFQAILSNARRLDAGEPVLLPDSTIARTTGTATILNDDGAVFSVNDVTITEGDAGTADLIFTVALTGAPSGKSFKVDVNTVNGTAVQDGANPDFVGVTQTLTFGAGVTQQAVKVSVRGDLIQETIENFQLLLSNAQGVETDAGPASISKGVGIGTIVDNADSAPTVSLADGRLVEGNNGTSFMEFDATLSAPANGLVTVEFSTQDGTGAHPATAANGDYTVVAGARVTFEPGQTTAKVLVPIVADTADEFDETLGVTLANAVGANIGRASAVGTITNDDITISVSDPVAVTEGDSGTKTVTFNVTLSQASNHEVKVLYATADGTATFSGTNRDFDSAAGTLTFPAGTTTLPVTVTVQGDTRLELDETFLLRLLSAENATIAADGANATATIANDDGAATVSIGNAQITESNGTQTMTFTVSLDKPSDVPVTVKAKTAPDTATATDFTAKEQVIEFAAGETSRTFTVQILGDTIDEAPEGFTVALSEPSAGVVVSPTNGQAPGIIVDDDLRTISVANVSIAEGTGGTREMTFTVSLSQPATQVVSVNYATADGTAASGVDYVGSQGTLTFNPAVVDNPDTMEDETRAAETSKTVTITINGDELAEGNERFFLRLTNAVNGMINGTGQAEGLILDDETTVRLVPIGSATVAEDGGTFVEFQVVREGDNSRQVTVDYQTVDGSAKGTGERADFGAKSGTITFAAGANTASGTIRININSDAHFENDESFSVRLFNPINAAVVSTAGGPSSTEGSMIYTITDNDVLPTVNVFGALAVTEGESGTKNMTFTVRLTAANEKQSATVTFDILDGYLGSDFPQARGAAGDGFLQDYAFTGVKTLTFAPGETEKLITVLINGDARDESDEEVLSVDLGTVSNLAGIGIDAAPGYIRDNDAAPSLVVSAVTVAEGSAGTTPMTFKVALSEVSERPISVVVNTKDGTAVSVGASPDFTPLDNFVVNYTPASGKELTFNVVVTGDTIDEANETLSVELTGPQFATFVKAADSKAVGTITDDDASPGISINNVVLPEGNSGTTEFVFTVSLSAASEQTVRVNFATSDSAAVSTGPLADFVAQSGTLEFAPGETTKEIRVAVNGDTFKEQNEIFNVNLSSPSNGNIVSGTGVGIGSILQDGDSVLGIAISDGFIAEGDSTGGKVSFTVFLSDSSATATPFSIVTRNGTAVRGPDFGNPATPDLQIDANQTSKTFTIDVVGDAVFEPTETFFVDLRNVASTVTVADGTGRGTIFNDDVRFLSARKFQYIDVDGDLVTVRVSQGSLTTANFTFGSTNATGGKQLRFIDFTDDGQEFQGTDLSVTAGKQKGFNGDAQGKRGDGRVNVGEIAAGIEQPSTLEVTNGIDLGVVKVEGDLGRIVAGDIFTTPGLERLDVRSLGRPGIPNGATNTSSLVLSRVQDLHVAGNLFGTFRVIGAQFGTIDNLFIGGALQGGSSAGSGQIFFTGQIKSGFIGEIAGGSGTNSGLINGSSSALSKIKSLQIGSIVGGSGDLSAYIIVTKIGALKVNHDVEGGTGDGAARIEASKVELLNIGGRMVGGSGEGSATIVISGNADKVIVGGGLFGGAGKDSGLIRGRAGIDQLVVGGIFGSTGEKSGVVVVDGAVKNLRVKGDIEGGRGTGSGGLDINGLLKRAVIGGSLEGGDSGETTSLVSSGYIFAKRIDYLYVNGDVVAGRDEGGGLANSGVIRSGTTIDFLQIHGSVRGNADSAVIISAPGTDKQPLAIKTLQVDGDLRFAEILAGYAGSNSTTNARGTAVNADAKIGKVTIDGKIQSSSIVAGAEAGSDGVFGTADDRVITGSVRDVAGVYSKIAQVIVRGGGQSGTSPAGIVAQWVNFVNLIPQALNSGPGNDSDRTQELFPDSNIRVFEVPVPV